MTTFQLILICFFSLPLFIVIYRAIVYGKFYITSSYNEEREYIVDEFEFKENLIYALQKSNFKMIKENNNTYSAISLPSIFSFSELIKVEVKKRNDSKFNVNIISRCLFPLQIFDYGKNKRNSNKFFKNLEEIIPK